MNPLHCEVTEARRSKGASVAHAVSQDPPGEERGVLVVPRGSQDFAVVVRLRESEAERDRAHAPDAGPPLLRSHVSGKRHRLYHSLLDFTQAQRLTTRSPFSRAGAMPAPWTPHSSSRAANPSDSVPRKPSSMSPGNRWSHELPTRSPPWSEKSSCRSRKRETRISSGKSCRGRNSRSTAVAPLARSKG